ncbi:MAG TPA: MaoC/PaaZ C-terminal domain-containing protein [Candidatus Binataceae bacterium]|nr:MaoC/PaaZ C-terminal domain-containing protein [Candidatus Binataceae bacterium]
MNKFEQIEVGEALGPVAVHITRERSRGYALMAGMDHPRFTDDAAARREGLPGMIVPGNMSAGLLAKLVTDWARAGGGRLGRIGVTYRAPVLPDHTVTLHGFVTQTDSQQRTAELDLWLENEEGERLVIGTATARFS